jgi:hypothetical protein
VLLRSLLIYRGTRVLATVLLALALWTVLFVLEALASRRWPGSTAVFIALQSALIVYLMAGLNLDGFDFFAVLFAVLSMQLMTQRPAREAAIWMTLFVVLMRSSPPALRAGGGHGFTLLYSAVNVFFGFYALPRCAPKKPAPETAGWLTRSSRPTSLRDDAAQREELAAARRGTRWLAIFTIR